MSNITKIYNRKNDIIGQIEDQPSYQHLVIFERGNTPVARYDKNSDTTFEWGNVRPAGKGNQLMRFAPR
jgi:hypothetical protein